MAMSEIMEAVNKLQPEYRLCFVMKVMDGYSYREITQQLSINENTAKWYVAEAKKTLKLLLIHYQKESDRYGS
jgi:RNA polymerase sigma-70 factor (ECF subfamily)